MNEPLVYSWYSALRSYQRTGAEWLNDVPALQRGRLLADPMGFGKGRTIAGAVRLRHERGLADNPCTPVITTALARTDIRREIKAVWPEALVHILGVDEAKYQKVKESDADFDERQNGRWRRMLRGELGPSFVISSYESLPDILQTALADSILFDSIIFDEAHYLKKAGALRSRAARPLVGKSRVTFLTTGTPIENRPYDLYNLLDLMKMGSFGGSFMKFAERYFAVRVTEGGFGRVVGELVDKERLAADLSPYVLQRSVREAFGELPARIRTLQRISVKKAHRVSPAKFHTLKTDGAIEKAILAATHLKLTTAVELAESIGQPVVLFAWQKETAHKLTGMLNKAGIPSVAATGDLPTNKRQQLIEDWKNGIGTALVCTMDAVRESATLTRAADTIFVDFSWMIGKQLQCEGRTDPSRQPENNRRPARYWYLCIEGGPDEIVAERLAEKIADAEGLPGASENQSGLGTMLGPLARGQAINESPASAMEDLIGRLEARAKRLTDIGLWSNDD